jgi:pSer/pThr/pTyr-binding forkhead associated (FHA) protein
VLVTPAGAREPISGTVVVGRQPAKTAFKGSDRSLILKDPEGQVSKSHAVFQVDEEGLWVRDLGSTNGVVVITPGGIETTVEGDARVAVPAGSEVELGGYVLTVEKNG